MKALRSFSLFLLLAAGASAQAALGPLRGLPGEAADATAVGTQDRAAIAAGASGYLAVWQDQRTILRGAPNTPDETLLGNSQDVYAARLDGAGNLLDRRPILVSNAGHVQSVPKVAWNGASWLVVFITHRPGDYYKQDIVGVRVAPSGALLDAQPIVIRPQSDGNGPSNLAVASDGSGWAVVWEEFSAAGVRGIQGSRVEADGSVGLAKAIWYDGFNTFAHDVAIAFAADRFLVAWAKSTGEAGTGRNNFLAALRVTPDLARLDAAPILLNDRAWADAERPSVTSDGTDFFVAWHDMANAGQSQVFGARVSRAGQLLDPAGIPISSLEYLTDLTPSVAWDGIGYTVAYNRSLENGTQDLAFRRLAADGRPAGAETVLASSALWESLPAVASAGDGSAQAVYLHSGALASPYKDDVHGRRIAADGTVGAVVPVSVGLPRQSNARMASGPAGHLLVYLSEVSGETRVMARRLDADGDAVSPEPVLLAKGQEGLLSRPDVAWNGSVYLAVWQAPEGILGRRLDAAGTLLDAAPQTIFAGSAWTRPAVGALGSDFLVVGTEVRRSSTVWQNWLQGVRVSGAGQVLDAPFLLRAGYELDPRVVAVGGNWLVVWESQPRHDVYSSGILGAFVSPAGSPGAPFNVHPTGSACGGSGCGDDPDVAAQGDSALVVWYDNASQANGPKIDARLIRADGTFPGDEIEVAQAAGNQLAPTVAADGQGGWVVAWEDFRTTDTLKQLRADVHVARLGAAGQLVDAAQVSSGPLSEVQPELAPVPGTPGAALLAYSALDPSTYRIALRTVGASGTTEPPPPPPPPSSAIASLTLNPASVVGSKTSVATVTLAQPAPAAGAKVLLSSANVNVATVPASVLVAAGTTSKTFTVTSKPVASSAMVGITAAYGGGSKTAVLTVQPPAVSGLTLSPATIAGGCQGSTGKVTLSGKAPVGGLVVPLTNTIAAASMPASVTVPAGATYATFPITAPAVTAVQTGTVSASYGGVTRSVTLKVRPIGLASLTLTPNPVVGPGSVTGTVTLECPAAPGSVTVALSSSTLTVAKTAVASVTIPAGSTTATFTVTTADVSAVSYATIKAVAGGVTRTVRLTVNP